MMDCKSKESWNTKPEGENFGTIVSEVQLILAEKRTSLAALRTGIAVLVLPFSVLSILITTSKYYQLQHVWYLFAPLVDALRPLAHSGPLPYR